jgi:hypothetical protein
MNQQRRISAGKAPSRRCDLIVHQLDDELLLYDPPGERTHRLNATAAMIWQHCTGEHTLEDMAALLTRQFEVDMETALRDTRTVLQQLEHEHLVNGAAV